MHLNKASLWAFDESITEFQRLLEFSLDDVEASDQIEAGKLQAEYMRLDMQFTGAVYDHDNEAKTQVLNVEVKVNGAKNNVRAITKVETPHQVSIIFEKPDFARLIVCCDIEVGFVEQNSVFNLHFAIKSAVNFVDKIANYVNNHLSPYLVTTKKFSELTSVDTRDDDNDSMLQRLTNCLSTITRVYENQIEFFRKNAYFKLKQVDKVDSFHRVNSFSSQTLRFIVEHPDELTPYDAKTGITYKGKNYLPRHTLVTDNVRDFGIYENEVVVGFLHLIIKNLKALLDKDVSSNLSVNFVKALAHDDDLKDIYSNQDKLKDIVQNYLRRFKKLFAVYKDILDVEQKSLKRCPRPTSVFLSVPAYHLIYKCIREYFLIDQDKVVLNDFVMSAMYKSTLYEYYVLLKLIAKLESKGFTFVKTQTFDYGEVSEVYNKSPFDNIFIFKKDDLKLTLTYQPVIKADKLYEGDRLYRSFNASISTDGKLHFIHDDLAKTVYTPDYLIDVENTTTLTHKFYIVDAKNKPLENVVRNDLMTLTMRYLLGIKTIYPQDTLVGVMVLCSQRHAHCVNPFESVKNPLTSQIEDSPFKIFTLNENSGDDEISLPSSLFS